MGFIVDIVKAVVDIVVTVVKTIVKIVVKIVEAVINILAMLLGWKGEDQEVEYYDLQNIPLFPDPDKNNPTLNVLMRAVLNEQDIAGDLLYATAFRSVKGNIRKFIQYIEQDKYYEGFPTIESHITYVDYEELDAVITAAEGVPVTLEKSSVGSLTAVDWIKYWMQENHSFDIGQDVIQTDRGSSSSSTSPASYTDTVSTSYAGNTHTITISDNVAVADSVDAETDLRIDYGECEYNEATDDYSIGVYTPTGHDHFLPYKAPTKPQNMHYVSLFYHDSDPNRQYLFIYKVGTGTYPELDDPNTAIDIDANGLQAIPAIPLRLNNVSFTSFEETKREQIRELSSLVSLDADAVLNSIMDDPEAKPGDLDNIYITFGVRMWDTSQAGMQYLFNMFQNLYSAQGVTKGVYDGTAANDEKPYNKIIVTATDYKYAFQFAHITYEHFTRAEIDADSGSVENGIYYSDMSRFNSSNELVYPYFSSSGKGTYNVGYKADNLDEVQDFLDRNGVVNPGDTSDEAGEWLQVTKRMTYTEELQEADGTVSDIKYLTPDMVYRNNGSGVLRMVEQASEETTAGQSITYYRITASGLEAYTVTAPMAVLKVEDAGSGRFQMVKFNLGAKDDLMVPFVYSFVKDLSNAEMSKLFLAGTHVSIYVAHYELIEARGFNLLLMIVIIIIIIIIIVVTWGAGSGAAGAVGSGATTAGTATGTTATGATISGSAVATSTASGTVVTINGTVVVSGTFASSTLGIVSTGAITGGTLGAMSVSWALTFAGALKSIVINQLLQAAITAIAPNNKGLAMVASVVGAVAGGGINTGMTAGGGVTFTWSMSWMNAAKMFATAAQLIGKVVTIHAEDEMEQLQRDYENFVDEARDKTTALNELRESLFRPIDEGVLSLAETMVRVEFNPIDPEGFLIMQDSAVEMQYVGYDYDETINLQIANADFFTYS